MGCDRAEAKNATIASSPSSSGSVGDELLYATMCMVGLPVHVQAKDGSLYSGIFHTACFQPDYGVVLKKAKREKKGKASANLVEGAIIDTLVILSEDIVQVVAKGVLLPVDAFVENRADSDLEIAKGSLLSQAHHGELGREQKALKSGTVTSDCIAAEGSPEIDQNRTLDLAAESISSHGITKTDIDDGILTKRSPKPLESVVEAENSKMESLCGDKVRTGSNVQIVSSTGRQAGKGKPQLEEDGLIAHKGSNIVSASVPSSSSSETSDGIFLSSTVIQSPDVATSKASTSTVDIIATSSSGPLTLQTVLVPKKSASATSSKVFLGRTISGILKWIDNQQYVFVCLLGITLALLVGGLTSFLDQEFKLNPGAKTFAPSFAHSITASPASSIGNVGHVPNSSMAVPVGGMHPGVDISPFLPRPSLPVKLLQYNNLVSGNSGNSPQYSLPFVGNLGLGSRQQPVRYGAQFQTGPAYVHPNPQTVMVGRMGQVVYVHPITHDPIHGTALTQIPARPVLSPHQAHLPKHQGTAAQTLQFCVAPAIAGVQQPFPVASHIPIQQPFPTTRPVPVPNGNGIFNSKF